MNTHLAVVNDVVPTETKVEEEGSEGGKEAWNLNILMVRNEGRCLEHKSLSPPQGGVGHCVVVAPCEPPPVS